MDTEAAAPPEPNPRTKEQQRIDAAIVAGLVKLRITANDMPMLLRHVADQVTVTNPTEGDPFDPITLLRMSADMIQRLTEWCNTMMAGNTVTCVYCGHEYGPDDGTTPHSKADQLKAHILKCPEHPLSVLASKVEATFAFVESLRDSAPNEDQRQAYATVIALMGGKVFEVDE